jgi:hypothetical protein
MFLYSAMEHKRQWPNEWKAAIQKYVHREMSEAQKMGIEAGRATHPPT